NLRQRCIVAIGTNPERAARVYAVGAQAAAGAADTDTGDGLQEARRQQRHQQQVDAVEAAVNSAVAAPDDGLVFADQSAEQAAAEFRIPGYRHARRDAAVEGVKRILAVLDVVGG